MAEALPQLYEVMYWDAEGEIIEEVCFYRSPYDVGTETQEREVHFLAAANELEATDYEVRHVRPHEVRKLLKKARREDFVDRILNKAARITGLDEMVSLMPAMAEMKAQDPINPNQSGAFAPIARV